MNNYFRILPDPPAKKDIAESLLLAARLSGRSRSTDVTLFTHYPYKIIEFLDGIIPGRERKKLVAGEAIHYHGVNISYATALDETKKYDVILAIDCLPASQRWRSRYQELQLSDCSRLSKSGRLFLTH